LFIVRNGVMCTFTPTRGICLSPGSTHFDTRSRHYPDTNPTLSRHPDTPTPYDTSVNRHSVRHSDTSVRPVSSHLDVGPHPSSHAAWRQAVSMVSKQNRHSDTRHPRHPRHPDTRHPRHSDTTFTGLDANEVQASMLTGLMMSRCLVCEKCVRGITHVHPPLYPLMPCCPLSCAHQVPSPPDSRAIN